jgi:hypothetical protein
MGYSIDYSKYFKDPLQLLEAARYALSRTQFGSGKVIRIDPDENNKFKYVLTATGESVPTHREAFELASSYMITKFESVVPSPADLKRSLGSLEINSNNPQYAQVGDIAFSIQENIRKARKDKILQKRLKDVGITEEMISEDGLKHFTIDIVTQGVEPGSQSDPFSLFEKLRKRQAGFIPFTDDEGASILQLKFGSRILSEQQTYYLLSVIGNPLFSQDFSDALQTGNTYKFLQKIFKREKRIFSARDITISFTDMQEYLGVKEAKGVIIEEGLEYMKKYLQIEKENDVVQKIMKGVDAETLVQKSFAESAKSLTLSEMGVINPLTDPEYQQRFMDNFMEFLRGKGFKDIVKASNTNQEFKKNFEELLEGSELSPGDRDRYRKIFDNFMSDAEKEFDGSGVLNKKILDGAKRTIKEQIKKLKGGLLTPEAIERIYQLETQLDLITNSKNLYQITGGGYTLAGLIKTAFNIRELPDEIMFILGRSSVKKELGIGGMVDLGAGRISEFISLSGFARSSNSTVYADPVSVAFHPEIFAKPEDIENMKAYADKIVDDFRKVVDEDILPPKITEMLRATLKEDYSDMPMSMRVGKERNRLYIERIFQLHQSGIGPKHSPEMMNLLHSVFASQAFHIKGMNRKEVYLPAMPGVQRFALASEAVDVLPGGKAILGSGISELKLKGATESADLLKFRLNNSQILFPSGAVADFYESLGGFDLDDKGILKLHTAEDDKGIKRILFSITRQPSYIQESIYARALLNDVQTLKNLFGKDEDFQKMLATMEKQGGGESIRALMNAITDPNFIETQFELTEDEVEEIILKAYSGLKRTGLELSDKQKKNIIESGASALKRKSEYSRSIKKIFAEAAEKNAIFDLKEQASGLLKSYKPYLGEDLYQELEIALRDEESAEKIIKIIKNNPDNAALKSLLTHSAMLKMTTRTGKANFLGVYINRSMIIGSTLNQFEDFMTVLQDTPGLDKEAEEVLKHKIGLLNAETAIDRSTGFTSEKFKLGINVVSQETLAAVERGERLEDIQKVALKALGYSEEQIAAITLDEVGEIAIRQLGRRMGAQTAIIKSSQYGGMFGEDLLPVIDEVFLRSRMQDSDVLTLLEEIQKSITTTVYNLKLKGKELDDVLDKLKHASRDTDAQRKLLTELFGAGRGHRYASMTNMDAVGRQTSLAIDYIKRASLGAVGPDQILAATQVSEDARKAAQVIIDANQDLFDSIIKSDIASLSDTERHELEMRRIVFGKKIDEEIGEAQKFFSSKLSREEIINAIEKVSFEKLSGRSRAQRFDLTVSNNLFTNLWQEINAAKIRRTLSFYGEMKGKEKELVEKFMEKRRIALQEEDFDQVQFRSTFLRDLNKAEQSSEAEKIFADILLGEKEIDETIKSASPEAADEARQMAKIFDARVQQQIMHDENQEFYKKLTERISSGGSKDENYENFRRALQAAVDGEDYSEFVKTKYRRFGFKNFIKSFKENKNFRNSVYAAGALVAASFTYSAFKDRTQEDIQGPPLLPGGSAYESGYPQRAAQIPEIGTISYNPGINYKVNLYGNRNKVSQFREEVIGLGISNMNTTMYNRIPEIGNDSYQQLASSF